MGFWLATLNPGKSSRRRKGGRRRKLSAWQRMVKKAGGVMQALKLRKKLGKGKKRRSGGRRRTRRNPFLTTALTSGGAKVLMNATKRRKRRRSKIRTRRSVVSRRSLRGRSRRASSRRSKMARKTRRRRLSRGRGGRFVSRRSRGGSRRRTRRTRRNPVLPISWNPRRRKRRSTRRRARRNPLFLSRKGFSARKHKGYRRLRMRRHAPRVWHNNPRRRRSYRRNPVLPISWNPIKLAGGAPGQILGKLKSFVDVRFWTETGVPAAAGYFGSKLAGGFVMEGLNKVGIAAQVPAVAQPYLKIVADALGGAGLSYLVGRFVGKNAGDSVWLGTVVNVAHAVLKQLFGGTEIARKIGLDGLGDDLAQRMKEAIAARVQGNLNGMGSYLRTTNLLPSRVGVGEYVTEQALRMQPSYSPAPGGLRDYDVTNQDPVI